MTGQERMVLNKEKEDLSWIGEALAQSAWRSSGGVSDHGRGVGTDGL